MRRALSGVLFGWVAGFGRMWGSGVPTPLTSSDLSWGKSTDPSGGSRSPHDGRAMH
ncbi:hypothetical protein B0T26DRAFT_716852 [Lasiosphaeria miniovina]|uniref:Secreted protein n=1 Tax=Lasiosphaeria miniovina TaxID=1954250 RepID=A0AA40DRV0_9PEZI|nr:uncharacterized protein B0T26DRAFT_716852 [Lasiosphaeria miniovina]KAK0713240.1 hypothetical protein B0T26DRAFT_716852 [Lasiosphaeria miniovina]